MNTENRDFASRKITAYFVPEATDSMAPIKFDATLSVLKLPLADIQELASNKSDLAITKHFTPPHIFDKACSISGIEQGILDFFNVKKGDQITKQMVDQARQDHGAFKPKTYKVTIDRVETRRITVEVEATDEHEAAGEARLIADQTNFSLDGHLIGAQFNCDKIEHLEVNRAEQPARRPRS